MVIMTGRFFSLAALSHRACFRSAFVLLAFAVNGFISSPASAYSLMGKSWASGSNVVLQLGLGNPGGPLTDGNTTWNAAVLPALTTWNQEIQRMQLSGVMDSSAAASSGDRINSVVFANNVFGQAFGNGTLAVTYYIMQGANLVEADVLFNRAQTFDSYRGPLRFPNGGGFAIADIRRVFVHELGHGIGLNHSSAETIMNATTGNREALAADDIAGARAMYGAPIVEPTPTPTPTPPPTGGGRLVNISTRLKVGLNDDVLIGGFVIKGSQPKRLLVRAAGPSLAAAGVPGVLQDPILDLHNSTGQIIASNDDWQTGGQSAEIAATGIAPTQQDEAAVVVDLQPGSYTAIIRGRNSTEGVALVEGYELDTLATRLVNLSTRGRIGTGDEVLIGGLVVQGSGPKKVIVRAVGPSLAGILPGALANPAMDIYNSSGQVIASNDDWTTSAQKAEIIASTLPPSHSLESAIVTTLAPGAYTAIVRGVNNGTGIGLVEAFDLDP